MINYYMFEIRPYVYSGQHGGVEKVLHLRVDIDGEEHHMERMLPNMQPFESEIEFYSRLANETLESKLKKIRGSEGE